MSVTIVFFHSIDNTIASSLALMGIDTYEASSLLLLSGCQAQRVQYSQLAALPFIRSPDHLPNAQPQILRVSTCK